MTATSVQALDRASPMPLWAQLEAELRRRLEAGAFDEGFPTDLELTETYHVSRHTVREAVRHLNKAGILRRERGRGTVVDRAEFEQSLGTLYSLYQSIESTGSEQTSEVLDLGVVVDAEVAEHLELDDDAELVLLARVRHADGEPLAIDRAWVPKAIGEPLLAVDWTHTALYDELARLGLPVPNQGWERLTAIVPADDDRKKLGLPAGAPAFYLERVGRRDGNAVEWRTTIVRGDRYRFVAEWSSTGRSQLRPTAV